MRRARDFVERTFCKLDSRMSYAAADIEVLLPTGRSLEEIALVAAFCTF